MICIYPRRLRGKPRARSCRGRRHADLTPTPRLAFDVQQMSDRPPLSLPPFQALLDAHGRDVRRFLIASVGVVDADDCWQETWLSALRAYPKLRDGSNLRAWVMTIAHRKVIDHARGRARRAVPVAEAEQLAGAAPAPAGGGGDGELWHQVARLAPKQRTAVSLRFLVDLSHAEIGEVMGISEAAARRNVHDGLNRLREKEL